MSSSEPCSTVHRLRRDSEVKKADPFALRFPETPLPLPLPRRPSRGQTSALLSGLPSCLNPERRRALGQSAPGCGQRGTNA